MTPQASSPGCSRFATGLEAYLDDRLAPREREAMRRHIAACAGCRFLAIEREPLQMFTLLAGQEAGPAVAEGFWGGVADGIARTPRPAPAVRTGPAWRATPAACAASLIIMIAAAILIPIPGARIPTDREPTGRVAVAGRGAASAASRPRPQTVEQVRTPEARDVQVYSMTWFDADGVPRAGAPGEVAELVLIVDAGLEL